MNVNPGPNGFRIRGRDAVPCRWIRHVRQIGKYLALNHQLAIENAIGRHVFVF